MDMHQILHSETDMGENIKILNEGILPEVVDDMNSNLKKKMAQLPQSDEPIPTHARNISGARSRPGLIFEFVFGRVLQTKLPDSYFVSYGANQSTNDVIIRNRSGKSILRFEVKSIEDVSEEHAPNFEDSVATTHPEKDILIIFAWRRIADSLGTQEIRRPYILEASAFPAREISKARDNLWLGEHEDVYKHIGLTQPVLEFLPDDLSETIVYLREEQGNAGKLSRILPFDKSQLSTKSETLQEYCDFISRVAWYGIQKGGRLASQSSDFSSVFEEGVRPENREVEFVKSGERQYRPNVFQLALIAQSEERWPLFVISGGAKVWHRVDEQLTSATQKSIIEYMLEHRVQRADVLIIKNEKFDWCAGTVRFDVEGESIKEHTITDRTGNLFASVDDFDRISV